MNRYYRIAKSASAEIGSHPGLLHLSGLAAKSKRLLDVGCGEGTRLHLLLPPGGVGWGIDFNPKAVAQAAKQYPLLNFRQARAENLPFPKNSFDLVFSAFTLEHVIDPEKVVAEMIRVCRPGGHIVIICPNFGAPSRRSPVSLQNPGLKFLLGLVGDFLSLLPHSSPLNWTRVTPRPVYDQIDADTTVEPYLFTLELYLRRLGLTLLASSSLWELEPFSRHPRKFILRFLGRNGIFPVKYWGPQIFVAAQKPSIPHSPFQNRE